MHVMHAMHAVFAEDHSDMDVALIKYRVAAVHTPNSAQLWNKTLGSAEAQI